MSEMRGAILWDTRFMEISFAHPMIRDVAKWKMRKFHEAIPSLGLRVVQPSPAQESDLLQVHTKDYIEKLKELSSLPYAGFIDSGDTYHYPGIFQDILLVVGASLTAMRNRRDYHFQYIPVGGLHHAFPDHASGFCPVNDVAIMVKRLENEGERVAIVDIDAHHGNGLQEILYRDPVLKLNIFAYDGQFFPGTGKREERGEGPGRGLNFNFHLRPGAGDREFLEATENLALVEVFRPTVIVSISGVDGHQGDQLHSMNLSCGSYREFGRKLRKTADRTGSRVIMYGGGGYGEESADCMVQTINGFLGR